MSVLPRVMALVLMGGMLLPSWAMRDCCCSRKTTSATVRPCCAERLAATTAPLKKCCAARLKSSASPTVVQADHGLVCRCAVTAPNAVDPNFARRVLATIDAPSWDVVTSSLQQTVPAPMVIVAADLPPPPMRAASPQIWLCRWRA